jgi:hypothetical protein
MGDKKYGLPLAHPEVLEHELMLLTAERVERTERFV